MRVLFIGDIFGRPGRRAVEKYTINLREEYAIDFCIANGENAAAGKGLTQDISRQLLSWGIDVITGGNHIWHNREIIPYMEYEPRILRPVNYPESVPGKGWGIYAPYNISLPPIAVISAMGRIFMRELDNPFTVIDKLLPSLRQITPLIFLDMHAEATSEKMALAWYLDGKVSAVIGTHTHVPTADEKILPKGTAYLTDAGMTGPYNSIIGVKKELILEAFLTQMPVKHEVGEGDVQLHGVIVDIDNASGKAKSIERISRKLPD